MNSSSRYLAWSVILGLAVLLPIALPFPHLTVRNMLARWNDGKTAIAALSGGTNCLGCHDSAQDEGGVGPDGGRRAVVGEFSATSHHVSGALLNADCSICHSEGATHADGLLQLVDGDSAAVYSESTPGAYRPANVTAADNDELTDFCQSCHDGDGATRLATPLAPLSGDACPPLAGTHANTHFAGALEATFENGCIQCHEGHGSANLALVNDTVLVVEPGTTTGPVVLTARSGANSFDEVDATEDAASNVDDLCVACHIHTGNPGYPMLQNVGGNHASAVGDQRGNDCITCHPHDLDADPATLDGLMASNTDCIACHASTQDEGGVGPDGGRRAVVGEFSMMSHHVSGTLTNADCQVCHAAEPDAGNHANGRVQLSDPDTGTVYEETSSGAFRTANLTENDLLALETFCQDCHDGDGALRLGTAAMAPLSGGAAPPTTGSHANGDFDGAIEAAFVTRCAQCHAAHGSANLALIHESILVVPGTTVGPVDLTAFTGSGSFDDTSSADSADLCTACHTHLSNPGYPMTHHSGGDHTALGGDDERENDCTLCHAHDQDGDPTTRDGLMASSDYRIWMPFVVRDDDAP